ncbi:glycosyl hydrolase family 43 [Nocardia tenerifensis]|uniref:Glycosyl hydrolase family 43 n=1 Tax=Nocardia tenerifensis TaxID=228006 RepID=A0A318K2A0_9NOCA|nr:family 43 glycosylhydrolase [Nocardia tenerifensis]PXX61614.1 glycosyl hydrolase family 43 [Nocardia tenerifensis]
MRRRSALAMAAGVPLSLLALKHATARQPAMRYTMTAFTNSSETDLYVYESTDATNFQLLRGPAYRPPTGLLRDPSLFRHVDGVYYLTYTTGWEGHTIGFASSTDRVNWTHMYDFPTQVPGFTVTSSWAPEWLIDAQGRVNVIVSLSDGCRFTPHLMTATDPSLRSWTPLTPLAGLGPPPGYRSSGDRPACDFFGYGYIDTTIVYNYDLYCAFTKNETSKLIELAVAPAPLGPYVFVATGNWATWGAPREGQCVIPLPGGSWRIFFDDYDEDHPRYLYSDSHDNFRTWTEPVELPELSGTVRHFTVLPEPAP